MSMLTIVEHILSKNENIVSAVVPKKEGKLKEYLSGLGINVHVYYYGGNGYYSKDNGYRRFKGWTRCLLKSIVSYYSCTRFSRTLTKTGVSLDIVYTNTSTTYFGAYLSKFSGAKHIWHFREYGEKDQFFQRIFESQFKRLSQKAALVITISQKMNEYYIEKYDLKNTKMLYDDLPAKYILRDKIGHDGVNILITGSLSETKGQMLAIKAVSAFQDKNVYLYVAGKVNDYGKMLEAYIQENGINNVFMCGLVSDMNALRKKMDFSIVCAKSEAFGRTIIEDMLAGIVVIGCDTGSVPELIENMTTGLIYKYGNVGDLEKKIEFAINNRELLYRISSTSFKYALGFTEYNTSEIIRNIIKEM